MFHNDRCIYHEALAIPTASTLFAVWELSPDVERIQALPIMLPPRFDTLGNHLLHESPPVKFHFGEEYVQQLQQMSRHIPVTLAVTFLSGWFWVGRAPDGGDRMEIVGVPLSEHPTETMDAVVGNFIRILVLRNHVTGDNWEQVALQTSRAVAKAFQAQTSTADAVAYDSIFAWEFEAGGCHRSMGIGSNLHMVPGKSPEVVHCGHPYGCPTLALSSMMGEGFGGEFRYRNDDRLHKLMIFEYINLMPTLAVEHKI